MLVAPFAVLLLLCAVGGWGWLVYSPDCCSLAACLQCFMVVLMASRASLVSEQGQ